eukprot:1162825-Heterocapsa_arctica.AAC.1
MPRLSPTPPSTVTVASLPHRALPSRRRRGPLAHLTATGRTRAPCPPPSPPASRRATGMKHAPYTPLSLPPWSAL